MFGEDELIKAHRDRVKSIGNIVLIAFGLVLSRLWFLQIYKGKELLQYSLQNRLRKEIIEAPRGLIFTRDNEMIVNNTPRFDVAITPQYFTDKDNTLEKLSKILKMNKKAIQKVLDKNSTQPRYKPIIVKKNVSRTEVALVETQNFELPGVSIETFISREYLGKEMGAHLLGYVSEISQEQLPRFKKRDMFNYQLGDVIGQSGVEEQYDLFLRGTDGHEFVEVDARGRKKRHLQADNLFKNITNQPSIPGKNIRLTIDQDLQTSAYNALEGKVGSAVALDVNSGEVLAYVSRPSFDPSNFSRELTADYWSSLINNTEKPLRDRNIQDHYSPGSTFKIIAALSMLETGIINENSEVQCSGFFYLGTKRYHCWKEHGHGKVNLIKAIRESCNIFFQKMSMKLDIDTLKTYANDVGLGLKTGISLPRETSGLIPSKEWKLNRNGVPWQLGETLSCVIGQSYILTTPLQLALAYATIVNGGKLFRPYIVKEVFTNSGEVVKKFGPEIRSEVKFSPKTIGLIKEGLYQVVNVQGGTAWSRRGKGIQMSGKTGTSQVIKMSSEKLFEKCEYQEYKYRNHGLFVGFAPKDKPKIAVAVFVEHGCHGATAAAPVAEQLITTYMKKYEPELHKQLLELESKKGLNKATKPIIEEGSEDREIIETIPDASRGGD